MLSNNQKKLKMLNVVANNEKKVSIYGISADEQG
jgi:hypothetical protein